MNTPICDFVRDYTHKSTVRMHMPGHKGHPFLGFEQNDITEFRGADDLYHPSGIILESEKNASYLFGCPTFYSTEGSSHCIRAMVYLATIHARQQNKKPCIAAVCNVHKSFLTAIIHLDTCVK
ncbi:MAG: amino acid decarboxylase, partial [Clostridia bacterium]|nr:amino acid decarboxylase [Clostridia bacterium]